MITNNRLGHKSYTSNELLLETGFKGGFSGNDTAMNMVEDLHDPA